MKKFLIPIFALFIVSFGFSQEKLKVLKYGVGSSGATATTYYDRTYAVSQVDTTDYVTLQGVDSVQFFFVANGASAVGFKVLLGDGVKAKILSAEVDSIHQTTQSYKGLSFTQVREKVGSYGEIMMLRYVLTFKGYDNGAGTLKYSVYTKKFIRK